MPNKNMPPEEIFSRKLFGVIMIAAAFVSWGKWVIFVLGVLFLISAFQGVCLTCILYKKIPHFACLPQAGSSYLLRCAGKEFSSSATEFLQSWKVTTFQTARKLSKQQRNGFFVLSCTAKNFSDQKIRPK